MTTVSFVVQGPPCPKPRPRVTARGTFMPPAYIAWRETVRDAAGVAFAELEDRGAPWNAHGHAYAIRVSAFLERADRGDVDNLLGGILDALNKFAFPDDRLVVEARASKRIDKTNPRVEVELREVLGDG